MSIDPGFLVVSSGIIVRDKPKTVITYFRIQHTLAERSITKLKVLLKRYQLVLYVYVEESCCCFLIFLWKEQCGILVHGYVDGVFLCDVYLGNLLGFLLLVPIHN